MAENTPESDLGSIECFQNYTAPEVFIQGLAGIVDQQDVEAMIRAQKQMLQRFEKTNEMLTNCNALSVNRLKSAGAEFKKHTQLLLEMKKDLDTIFRRIRVMKTKLASQYPQAFSAVTEKGHNAEEEDEADAKAGPSKTRSSSETTRVSTNLASVGLLKETRCQRDKSNEDLRENHEEFEDVGTDDRHYMKRGNSSSTDSPNGNSNNESSPCTSDTG
ncbi:KxDL motif-containing protein CG10681 [Cryptotermes secundus]|uniref:KxDL motif-containing protein CG10681 n=1 Tax=Cryptotermes secundus TaxID=105785 RepID=A0A2J7Q0C3_9NEOP|nr:kxDL motif-containing protein CG10681 [Cryptotermes secundus]PNF22034.1 KxDL motif-containing protein CG10681 [Cryptotermes secundus]